MTAPVYSMQGTSTVSIKTDALSLSFECYAARWEYTPPKWVQMVSLASYANPFPPMTLGTDEESDGTVKFAGRIAATPKEFQASTPAQRLALAVLAGDTDAALALADEVLMTFHKRGKATA